MTGNGSDSDQAQREHADQARNDCLSSLRYCANFWPKVESFHGMIVEATQGWCCLLKAGPPPTHTNAPVIYMHENNTKLNEIF